MQRIVAYGVARGHHGIPDQGQDHRVRTALFLPHLSPVSSCSRRRRHQSPTSSSSSSSSCHTLLLFLLLLFVIPSSSCSSSLLLSSYPPPPPPSPPSSLSGIRTLPPTPRPPPSTRDKASALRQCLHPHTRPQAGPARVPQPSLEEVLGGYMVV